MQLISNTTGTFFMSVPQQVAEKRVAVVIVNWNGWRDCIECLDSIFCQSHENFHVFVVDNESHDGSIEHIVSWCDAPKAEPAWRRHEGVSRLSDRPNVGHVRCRVIEWAAASLSAPSDDDRLTLIRSGGNLGFAGGCNVGIKAAGLVNFDYFWFLNADAVVERQALVELIARADKDAAIGMVGSTVRYYDAPDVVQAMGGAQLNRSNGSTRHIGEGARVSEVPADGAAVERDLAYIMGASMLVSQKYIADVGLMEEDYFLYFEDADWAMRGSGKFSFGYAPRSHVFHKWGANSHKAMPLFSSGFFYRNRLRFVARFLPRQLGAAKRVMFEQMLRHLVRGRWGQARLVGATLLMARKITNNVTRGG
ncbi:MAG: glycosyltransferase family 2 protein [Pseudomonadota bacterium]|nr:glycosyltransferase family 2 protein [Pseudomonadota bacterium]